MVKSVDLRRASRWLAFLALGAASACGGEGGGSGKGSDACSEDAACDDASLADPGTWDDASVGKDDEDAGTQADAGEPDASIPGTPSDRGLLSDYIPCDSTPDCPIGVCVTSLPLNRRDQDGTQVVTLSALFPELPQRGVCSQTCSGAWDECSQLRLVDPNDQSEHPFTCQIVAVGVDPYARAETSFPYSVDEGGLQRGQAFAGLCRPPFGRHSKRLTKLCEPCSANTECGGGRCASPDGAILPNGKQGVCLESCSSQADCATGFVCQSQSHLCVPVQNTCGHCIDLDGDGRGLGFCGASPSETSAFDCDDSDPDVYYAQDVAKDPRFLSQCAHADINCNGIADDVEIVGPGPLGAVHCAGCFDACEGDVENGRRQCREEPGAESAACGLACDETHADCDGDPSNGCETQVTDPSRIYFRDSDGDGRGDPNVTTFDCAATGIPAGYVANNADCDDDNPDVYGASNAGPAASEVCDTLDNDCNGAPDDVPGAGGACAVAGLHGVCAVGQLACAGASDGALSCQQVNFPQDEVCDGLDNDCDGTDDNLTDTCIAQSAKGICRQGRLVCSATAPYTAQCQPGTPQATDIVFEPAGASGEDLDTNCDGMDGDLSRSLFVWGASVNPNGDGSLSNPFQSFESALDTFDANPDAYDVIFVAEGTYQGSKTWELKVGLTVVGGMQRVSASLPWNFPTAQVSTYNVAADLAVEGRNLYAERKAALHNLRIRANGSESAVEGATRYGIRCRSCGALTLLNVTF